MRLQSFNGTSAGQPVHALPHANLLVVGGALATLDSTGRIGIECVLLEETTVGAATQTVSEETSIAKTPSDALADLRRISGLTWEQLSRVFGVARRSLHFWASGKPLSAGNEERLRVTLATIRFVDRGSASANRSFLTSPLGHFGPPLELLAEQKYDTLRELAGEGPGRPEIALAPLAASAAHARRPPSPDRLVGAGHEPVHREVGKSRPARATRSKRK